ncbi:MAG: TerB N-terminal domain-containing protein [Acutalibacteraceae bacterium]
MSDVNDIINLIINDEKLSKSRSFSDKVYGDEPIIKVASKMNNYLPKKYVEMKKLATSSFYSSEGIAETFYKQAVFMEDFEDSYDFKGSFSAFMPTYRSMSNAQLRGYFSWRTDVRHGIINKVSDSFAAVYIFELLNQIGADSPEDGLKKIIDFCEAYRGFNGTLSLYSAHWIIDYVVYHNLNKSLVDEFIYDYFDESLDVLINCRTFDDEKLFDSLCFLSSNNIINSKFCRDNPDLFKAVVCSVIRALTDYFEKKRKTAFYEYLFGRIQTMRYQIFSGAVFYDRIEHEDYTYKFNDALEFSCKNGVWYCRKLYFSRNKSQKLSSIIKNIDSSLRKKLGYRFPLKPVDCPKTILKVIESEIDRFFLNKKKEAANKIEIDVSKLGEIRAVSEVTKNKLIVDNELSEAAEINPVQEVDEIQNDSPLDDTEYRFMQCLLYGRSYAQLIKDSGILLSVIADSVNEKLFDLIGDTAIIFDGDKPELIEDYIDELKGIISE